jgi:phage baseplate assembly protein W
MADLIFYKDLSLDFIPHPVSGDIRPVTNETAIRRSLSNLIRTRRGDRPFRPDYGSTVHKYLFDHGVFAEDELNKSLYETIQKFETRVIVTRIESSFASGGIDITIDYIIKNINRSATFQTTITRVA